MRKYIIQSPIRVAGLVMLTAAGLAASNLAAGTAQARELRPRTTTYQDYARSAPARQTRAPSDRGERAGYDRVYGRPGEAVAATDYMPIGNIVMAPTGFLEMCARSPMDCAHSASYDAVKIRDEARQALVRKYDIAFGRAPRQDVQTATIADTDAQPAAIDDAPQYIRWNGQDRPLVNPALIASTVKPVAAPALFTALSPWNTPILQPVSITTDVQPGAISDAPPTRYLNWRDKAVTARPVPMDTAAPAPVSLEQAPYDRREYRASLVAPRAAPAVRTTVADYERVPVSDANMRVIRVINNDVNRTIRSESDMAVYGKADYWAAPGLMRNARGDCEDFALEKRRQLIENGIPAGALSVAVVVTRRGLEHAVLIVSTTEGDLVLDNMQYDVRPWRQADYTWVSRQAPGQTLNWVSLSPANGSGTDRQIRATRVAYAR